MDARPRRRRGLLPRRSTRGSRCGWSRSPTVEDESGRRRGSCGRSTCCGAAFTPGGVRHRARPGLHQRQRRADGCIRTIHHLDHVHHARSSRPATSGRSSSRTPTSASRPRSPPRSRAGWGSTPTVIPQRGRRARGSRRPPPTRRRPRRGVGSSGGTCWRSAASSRARALSTCVEAYRLAAADDPDVRLVHRRRRDAVRLPRLPGRVRRAIAAELRRRAGRARSGRPRRAARRWWPRRRPFGFRLDQGGLRAGRDGGARRRRRRSSSGTCRCCREVFGDHVRYGGSVAEIAAALEEALTGPPPPGGAVFAASHSWTAAAQAHLDFYRAQLQPSALSSRAAVPR